MRQPPTLDRTFPLIVDAVYVAPAQTPLADSLEPSAILKAGWLLLGKPSERKVDVKLSASFSDAYWSLVYSTGQMDCDIAHLSPSGFIRALVLARVRDLSVTMVDNEGHGCFYSGSVGIETSEDFQRIAFRLLRCDSWPLNTHDREPALLTWREYGSQIT